MILDEHPTAGAYYENEHVDLDDKTWLNCTFKNCTFSATKRITLQGCIITESELSHEVYRFITGYDKPGDD